MSPELKRRAEDFLRRPVPPELDYVPGSIAEQAIAAYARDGRLDLQGEFGELIELSAMEAEAAAERGGAAAAYLGESAAILRAILESR